MEGALTSVAGVKSVKLDYAKKTALVQLEKDAKVDEKSLVSALEDAGFGGSVAN